MAFAVTHDFTSNTKAQAAQVNTNFSDIETELNAFPTSGILKDGAISATAKIADGVITWAKLAAAAAKDEDDMASNSATAVASQQSIKAYVDNQLNSHLGTGTFSPTSYAGEQSITFPNGLIIKRGTVTGATGVGVAYSTAFPNACVNVQLTPAVSVVFSAVASGADDKAGFTVYHNRGSSTNVMWLAIGY